MTPRVVLPVVAPAVLSMAAGFSSAAFHAPSEGFFDSVRGSYSARVPRSSLARLHREFVHRIVEEEAEDQVDEKDDRRESGKQEEAGRVAENQTHNMSA